MVSFLSWIKWVVFCKEWILRWIILSFEVIVLWLVVVVLGEFKYVDFKVVGFLIWIFNKFDWFILFLNEIIGFWFVEGLIVLIEWFFRWFFLCCFCVGFNIL